MNTRKIEKNDAVDTTTTVDNPNSNVYQLNIEVDDAELIDVIETLQNRLNESDKQLKKYRDKYIRGNIHFFILAILFIIYALRS